MCVILRELFEAVPRDIEVACPDFLVGRAPSCDCRLTDGAVSWQHCKIDIEHGCVIVHDLGSHLGTLVNGKRVKQDCELKHGDILEVGLLFYFVDTQGTRKDSPKSAKLSDLTSQAERQLLL